MAHETVRKRSRRIVRTTEENEGMTPEERRQAREFLPSTGFIALLPDWLVPEDSKRHLWLARREALLAARSLLVAAVTGNPMIRRALPVRKRFEKGW